MLTELKVRALFAGVFGYVGAFILFSVLLYASIITGWGVLAIAFPLSAVFWLLSLIALASGGFIAGWLAGERGLLHGFLVGLAGSLVVAAAFYVVSPHSWTEDWAPLVIVELGPSIAFTMMGGSVGALLRRRQEL